MRLGGDVLLAGVEPTPAVAFLTIDAGADAGVVISASHNPPEYNGIKFFGRDGMKLPDGVEDKIEAALGRSGPGDRRRGLDPGPRGWPRAVPGAPRGGGGAPLDGMTHRGRLRQRRRLRARSRSSTSGSGPPSTRSTPPPTGRTSTSVAGPCTRRWPAPRSSSSAPTPACRTTATPTALCSPTRRGRVIDGDQVLAALRDRDEGRGHAARRRRGHDRHGEPRVPSGDEGCRDRGVGHARWAIGMSSRRCSRRARSSAASSPATDLPRPRDDRRRSARPRCASSRSRRGRADGRRARRGDASATRR